MLREAFKFIVFTVAFLDVVTQIFNYGHAFSYGSITQFAISGFVLGYWEWGDQEAKYKKALNSSPQTSLQPH